MESIQRDFLDIVFTKYAFFYGRARRREYWMFQLWAFVGYFALAVLAALASMIATFLGYILIFAFVIYCLGLVVPSFCLAVRRLHDIGQSGWFLLLSIIPLGGLVVLVMCCLDSQPGENKYGPNPKGVVALGQA
ncbi:MAG: DUF805 domain-containing protein [Deltaproteobacteria bacterium]|nr:DUF805 domain-containing protein [Deltaproteobacteria bacterium]